MDFLNMSINSAGLSVAQLNDCMKSRINVHQTGNVYPAFANVYLFFQEYIERCPGITNARASLNILLVS